MLARWPKVALRELLSASCSAQVALCKFSCASAQRKLLCTSFSATLRRLLCTSCPAQVAPRKRSAQGAGCSAQVPCASCSATFQPEPRVGLRALLSYLQAATCEPELRVRTSRATFVLGKNDTLARRHSESASTRTIPAEGPSGTLQSARRHCESASTTRAEVSRRPQKPQKVLSFWTSTTPIPAEGRVGAADHRQKSAQLFNLSAEGHAQTAETLKVLLFNIDHVDLRTGQSWVSPAAPP